MPPETVPTPTPIPTPTQAPATIPSASASQPNAESATPSPEITQPAAAKLKEEDLSSALDSENELDLDEVEGGEADASAEKAEGDAEALDAKAKEGEAAAAKPPEAPAPVAPATPPPAETQPQPTQPAAAGTILQAQNLEEVQAQFSKWRNESEELLAKHHYVLPAEVVSDLEGDGVSPKLLALIPRMGARIYLDAVQATMGQIMTHLPQLMSQVTKAREEGSQLESTFYTQWPKLKEKPEFADTVRRIGTAYRQINPRATSDEFIREVGAGAMIALRLPMETSGTVAPAAPKGSFRPAAATRPVAPKPSASKNPFEQMVDEDKVEELDLDT